MIMGIDNDNLTQGLALKLKLIIENEVAKETITSITFESAQ